MELLWAVLGGGLTGALAGYLGAHLDVVSKDMRDARSQRRGGALPNDRVFQRGRWAVTALLGAGLAPLVLLLGDTSWYVAAAAPLVFLATSLLGVGLRFVFG